MKQSNPYKRLLRFIHSVTACRQCDRTLWSHKVFITYLKLHWTKNRIKRNKNPELFFLNIPFHFAGEGRSHFDLGTPLQHHPPFTEAQHRMLSRQMFSLPRTAHHLRFLLALCVHWLSTEEPQPWSLPLPPTWPTQTHAKPLRCNVSGLGNEKGTQVRSKWTEASRAVDGAV